MEFHFEVFDTGNLIAFLALAVSCVSLLLNISDRWQRRTRFRIADARAYTMRISTVDSHILLSFHLLNVSSRPLSLDNLHIRLKSGVSLPVLSAIEGARLLQLVEPSEQAIRLLVAGATSLPTVVPSHGAVQIDALFCLKNRKHIADLLEFRNLPPSKLYTLNRIVCRLKGEALASFDLVLSVHGRSRFFQFCPGSIAFFEPEDIDDGQTIQ